MQDQLRHIISEIRGAWRFRWLAVAVAWAVCGIGWIFILSLEDVYESKADVYVDTTSATRALLDKMTVGTDVLGRVDLVTIEMTGRPLLEKVAREADLHLSATSEAEMTQLISKMQQQIRISKSIARKNRYEILYRDQDPITAYKVVSTLLDVLVEDSLGANRLDTRNAQVFLREQLAAIEEELESAENRLADFKRNNIGRMPGTEGDYFQKLQDAIDELAEVGSNLRFSRKRQATLKEQLTGDGLSSETGTSSPLAEIDERILGHEKTLEDLQLRYTDLHPDVLALKATIEQLRRQKDEQYAEFVNGDAIGLVSDNPVFQSIQMELSRVDVEIAGLQEKRAAMESQIAELRDLIDVVPQTEAELARLNRDYEVKQTQYNSLLQRLQMAELSESAEQASDIQFRIIDPPTVPEAPSWPPRNLFIFATVIAGLVAGAAIAFLANLLRPVFSDAMTLQKKIGLPVLGSVTALHTRQRIHRIYRELSMLGLSLGALFVLSIVIVYMRDTAAEFFRAMALG
jgi:polysaccharide chain length determinant protein (PEP-CTERM system associated)